MKLSSFAMMAAMALLATASSVCAGTLGDGEMAGTAASNIGDGSAVTDTSGGTGTSGTKPGSIPTDGTDPDGESTSSGVAGGVAGGFNGGNADPDKVTKGSDATDGTSVEGSGSVDTPEPSAAPASVVAGSFVAAVVVTTTTLSAW